MDGDVILGLILLIFREKSMESRNLLEIRVVKPTAVSSFF